MKLRRLRILFFCLLLLFTIGTAPALADESGSRFREVEAVYKSLLENHISKPQPGQLVEGALQFVSEQLRAGGSHAFTYSPDDNTLAKMESRLQAWQQTSKMDWKKLGNLAIEGMLKTLDDPHTMFFTKEELKSFQADVENEVVGFGIRLRVVDGQPIIREVIPNSPAAMAGLNAGDILVSVDGVICKGKSFSEVFELLRGEEGSESAFAILPADGKAERKVKMTRAVLSIPEVSSARFAGDIGYVRLDTFGSQAGPEFLQALLLLQKNTALRGLVIDLRDNGGGYLNSARDLASLFIEDGVLMYTTNRNDIEVETWVRNGRTVNYPVVILVNESTASASEMLSGALQDYQIAKLVGTTTYGKGSAQQVIPLEDGDALKITLHEYFTPKHRVVNHVGLKPDVVEADDIGQVIAGLKLLGVSHFQLKETADEVLVNGVSFITVDLFQQGAQGLSIRSAVLKQLTGDDTVGETGYTLLQPYLQKHKELKIDISQTGIVLSK